MQRKKIPDTKESPEGYSDTEKHLTLYLFYYLDVEIVQRIDDSEIPLTNKYLIPAIAGFKWITVGYALSEISYKINLLINKMELQAEVQEILDKGVLFKEMEEFQKKLKK